MKFSKIVFPVGSGIQTYPNVLQIWHILLFEHIQRKFHYTIFIHLDTFPFFLNSFTLVIKLA